MIRTAVTLAALAVALLAVPALAQDAPRSDAMFRQIPLSIPLLDPEPAKDQSCSVSDAVQSVVVPNTGSKQAEPIVVIPLESLAGNIARATERAQRAYACEQGHTP
jgi:hypothetical protein